ncbi:uncharacterized protein K460DRAFT_410842 [Cucurbitaria berberidis CBS 394.84]|uniref:Uncharacterized protein n=1 Tax=Cucurbitaria berberidis CBS 394.84 TaxID=1168544 RepID=A0A9P4G726_9PLEO|nr:uncharacterized protein K460DRAFT_410842 [Cucurbitaria berberidis CBS 394.84]KAF1840243.1 hypothetical protein K460DRAFT_410842 [Cucurbitaria berberidis CBS 394.84]
MDVSETSSTTVGYLCRLGTTLADLFIPTPLRQNPQSLSNKMSQFPMTYRYIALCGAIVLGLAEWEQPGFLPNTDELTTALVAFLCAGLVIFVMIALMDFADTYTWPWDEDGWVWPWEALLWGRTVYADELRESVALNVPPLPRADRGEGNDSGVFSQAYQQPFIIPPTPHLPSGLRPVYLPPPEHKSGLLGESPMTRKA